VGPRNHVHIGATCLWQPRWIGSRFSNQINDSRNKKLL